MSRPRPGLKTPDRSRRTWLAGAAAGLVLAGHGRVRAQTAAPALGQRVNWPELNLLDGARLSPSAWSDRAAVVVFFRTDCPFCRRHNRHLNRLVQATHGQPLLVLGVAQDRDPQVVRRYLAEEGHRFAVTLAAEALQAVLSPRRVIPLTCVTDRQGRLREVIPGEMFEEDVLGLARWAQA